MARTVVRVYDHIFVMSNVMHITFYLKKKFLTSKNNLFTQFWLADYLNFSPDCIQDEG